jgi:hypothetical protein
MTGSADASVLPCVSSASERVGAEDEPRCKLVRPADCIAPHPDFIETPEDLQAKYETLHG